MKDVKSGISIKNISDLVLKELRGVLKTKSPTKEQISEYKITGRELYEKFDNLSEEELNAKSNKIVYIRNDVMTTIIKRCRGKKKRGTRAIDGFRKKLMIPDSEIPACPEFEIKLKIGKLLMNKKILEEYSAKIYEIDHFFYVITKLTKMVTNTYYLEFMSTLLNIFQPQKLMNKTTRQRTYIEKKRQEVLEKNLVVSLLELIQVMQKEVMIQIMKLVKYKHL